MVHGLVALVVVRQIQVSLGGIGCLQGASCHPAGERLFKRPPVVAPRYHYLALAELVGSFASLSGAWIQLSCLID